MIELLWPKNPKERRKRLSLISAGLILAALAAGQFLDLPGVRDSLMVAAALVAGSDIALRAFLNLRNRAFSIELLVTIAAAGGIFLGEYWEAAAVTFLFIFGAFLEARTMSQTRQVLQSLFELVPEKTIVLRKGIQVEVNPSEVQVGETVLVKPGGKVAVDGEVIEGRSTVDESAITGEPMPESKVPGAKVFAGTINQNGLLHVRATSVGAGTTLAHIIRRVEEAQEEKAPTQRFIERFARWYTPAIIGVSTIVYLATRDIELALTLLVIACPGALVISTPVSVVAGIGRGAKTGTLIKGGEHLENSGKITALALDKTGTLTEGKPRLTDVIVYHPAAPMVVDQKAGEMVFASHSGGNPAASELPAVESASSPWTVEQRNLLRWVLTAESGSEHPLAKALLAEEKYVFVPSVEHNAPLADEFDPQPGKGIRARYQGSEIVIGNREMMQHAGIELFPEMEADLIRLMAQGKTAMLASLDGEVKGLLAVSDPIRPSSAAMVKELKANGVRRILMLTGDDQITADAIAQKAGITEVHAELLPDDKLEVIKRLKGEGYVVAMVGDGINDALALAAADVGIAIGLTGTDIAIETADIALMSDDLMKIADAVRLSKRTLRNIRQNVAIALATVAILFAGVFFADVRMAGGMLVHEASVMIVILNAIRLLRD